MSIITCSRCTRYVDSDFHNYHHDEKTGEDICESCFEKDKIDGDD